MHINSKRPRWWHHYARMVCCIAALALASCLSAQCDSTNSPSFQVITSPVFPATNGTCGISIKIVNLQSSTPGGAANFSVYAPSQGSIIINPPSSVSVAISSGIYTVMAWQPVNNCSTTKTVQINILLSPTVTVMAGTGPSCYGSSVSLTANGASSYTWHTGSNSPTITVNALSLISYTVKGMNSNGCGYNYTGSLAVLPAPVLSVSPMPTNVCLYSSLQFIASGASTYTWNSQSTGSVFISPAFTSPGPVNYNLMLQGTDSLGCNTVKNFFYPLQVQTCDVGVQNDFSLPMRQVQIFPNPCSKQLHISIAGTKPGVVLTIFDVSGRVVLRKPIEADDAVIQLDLSNGIYLCEIKNSSDWPFIERLAVTR